MADDGQAWSAGTDMMAPTLESAEQHCDFLNNALDLNREQWKYFASAVFAVLSMQAESD